MSKRPDNPDYSPIPFSSWSPWGRDALSQSCWPCCWPSPSGAARCAVTPARAPGRPPTGRPPRCTRDGLSVLAESDAPGLRLHTGVRRQDLPAGHRPGQHHPGPPARRGRLDHRGDLPPLVPRDRRPRHPGGPQLHAAPAGLLRRAGALQPRPPRVADLPRAGRLPAQRGVRPPRHVALQRPRRPAVHPGAEGPLATPCTATWSASAGPGRAGGTYTTDVSRWLAAWIIGVEWDPQGVGADRPDDAGGAVHARDVLRRHADATPSEKWIVRHMDGLAASEAARG